MVFIKSICIQSWLYRLCNLGLHGCAGDTVPLDTFVQFASGSDVVIHESVGPVWNFSTAGVAGQNILLVCSTALPPDSPMHTA